MVPYKYHIPDKRNFKIFSYRTVFDFLLSKSTFASHLVYKSASPVPPEMEQEMSCDDTSKVNSNVSSIPAETTLATSISRVSTAILGEREALVVVVVVVVVVVEVVAAVVDVVAEVVAFGGSAAHPLDVR